MLNDDPIGPPDLDDEFRVEPGDMLYKPLRKGNAIMLNAGTVLTVDLIHKIADAGLLGEARRSIKKAIKAPLGEEVARHFDVEIEKAQRIRDSLSGLRAILWLLLFCTAGYAALGNFQNLFYVYLAAGIFGSVVITYLVTMSVYDKQTALMKQKSARIRDARRRLEEEAERNQMGKIDEMRSRLEGGW